MLATGFTDFKKEEYTISLNKRFIKRTTIIWQKDITDYLINNFIPFRKMRKLKYIDYG